MDAPPVQYVTTSDGYDIAYTDEGSGQPFVVMPTIFHHLLQSRSLTHQETLDELSGHFCVIRYDHRGQGLSRRGLSRDHVWPDYVLDLEALLERLRLEAFILFAPGRFATVAIRFVAAHPQLAAALVLLNPTLGEREGEAFSPGIEHLAELDWEYFLELRARTSGPEEDPDLLKETWRQSVSQPDFLLTSRSFYEQSVETLLAEIKVPTLILASRTGSYAYATESTSKRLTSIIPGAHLVFTHGTNVGPTSSQVTSVEEFLRQLPRLPAITSSSGAQLPDGLSIREIEVLRLVGHGLSNQQIADELVISINTVRRHVSNIFDKTGVANRAQAVAYARDHDIE